MEKPCLPNLESAVAPRAGSLLDVGVCICKKWNGFCGAAAGARGTGSTNQAQEFLMISSGLFRVFRGLIHMSRREGFC